MSDEEELYEVENVVDSRIQDGVVQYRVRWVNFTANEDTWEPEENLFTCRDLIERFLVEKKNTTSSVLSKLTDELFNDDASSNIFANITKDSVKSNILNNVETEPMSGDLINNRTINTSSPSSSQTSSATGTPQNTPKKKRQKKQQRWEWAQVKDPFWNNLEAGNTDLSTGLYERVKRKRQCVSRLSPDIVESASAISGRKTRRQKNSQGSNLPKDIITFADISPDNFSVDNDSVDISKMIEPTVGAEAMDTCDKHDSSPCVVAKVSQNELPVSSRADSTSDLTPNVKGEKMSETVHESTAVSKTVENVAGQPAAMCEIKMEVSAATNLQNPTCSPVEVSAPNLQATSNIPIDNLANSSVPDSTSTAENDNDGDSDKNNSAELDKVIKTEPAEVNLSAYHASAEGGAESTNKPTTVSEISGNCNRPKELSRLEKPTFPACFSIGGGVLQQPLVPVGRWLPLAPRLVRPAEIIPAENLPESSPVPNSPVDTAPVETNLQNGTSNGRPSESPKKRLVNEPYSLPIPIDDDCNLHEFFKIDMQQQQQEESQNGRFLVPEEFFDACREGSFDLVRSALTASKKFQFFYELETMDKYGNTLLMCAVLKKCDPWHWADDVIEILVQYGANVNALNKIGDTALMLAIDKEHLCKVTKLLSLGAAVNLPNSNGETPLMVACRKGFHTVAQRLLEYGADFNAFTTSGEWVSTMSGHNRNVAKALQTHENKVKQEFDLSLFAIFEEEKFRFKFTLFPIHCYAINESRIFRIMFDYKGQKMPSNCFPVICVGVAKFAAQNITVRFWGPTPVNAIVVNDVPQKPLQEDGRFVFTLHPLKVGKNEVLINCSDNYKLSQCKLLTAGYYVQSFF